MERYVCIHGHFYQPPRENAWLEAVELQDSAYPYHDWNERITAECYAPNATSRILDNQGRIVEIVNTYSKISFNFGPTLLAWLQVHAPDVYQGILTADAQSRERFSGHGSALALAYNHLIMPLANPRDRLTQVLWGMQDFERRFGRKPEGMWLPETAVDLPTLELLAEAGLLFTILAPHQASRVRVLDSDTWQDVSGGEIDPTSAYLVRLPSGKTLSLFFYDGPISQAVAFEGLLNKGEVFARRLMSGFSTDREGAQMLHIATDGESYGHHHQRGNMALAYALHTIESQGLAHLTNYGEFLEKHPPAHEVEIFENSAWSCVHGVERWWKDCGCSSGQQPDWNQAWRTPLREAFDWLRDALAPAFEAELQGLVTDPWAARNDYIQVVLDRSPAVVDAFLNRWAARPFNDAEKTRVIKLMELQRHAMLMYTSCGWFFDDVSGIETVQVIQYAGRALQIAEDVFGDGREPRFLELLQKAHSNIAAQGDGRRIYERFVAPAKVNLETVGAHYAMSSLFDEYPETTPIYCYTAQREECETREVDRAKLAIGRVRIASTITRESACFRFGVLHWGDHNLSAHTCPCPDTEEGADFAAEMMATFSRADFPGTLLLMEKTIGASTYSLRNLFRDEQRRILNTVLDTTLENTEGLYRQVYENNAPLLRFLKDNGIPAPRAIAAAAEYVLNAGLKRAFEAETLDLDAIRDLLENAQSKAIALDGATLEITIRRRLERLTESVVQAPADLPLLSRLDDLADLVQGFPFKINLRNVQNRFFDIWSTARPEQQRKAQGGDSGAQAWIERFTSLGGHLAVKI